MAVIEEWLMALRRAIEPASEEYIQTLAENRRLRTENKRLKAENDRLKEVVFVKIRSMSNLGIANDTKTNIAMINMLEKIFNYTWEIGQALKENDYGKNERAKRQNRRSV